MNLRLNQRLTRGFTLMETVIAIGVLAVLLTAFLAVFDPATRGIRKAISIQEADRLAYALEKELVTLRKDDEDTADFKTGFEKAYNWIEKSNDSGDALLIYQYRVKPGTTEPFIGQGIAGQDFIVQPMVRKKSDKDLEEDLKALEGRIYTVKLTQLVFSGGELVKGEAGKIEDPTPDDGDAGGGGSGADSYPEAVIAFAAEFFSVPNSSYKYVSNNLDLEKLRNPMFTRNLAVRR